MTVLHQIKCIPYLLTLFLLTNAELSYKPSCSKDFDLAVVIDVDLREGTAGQISHNCQTVLNFAYETVSRLNVELGQTQVAGVTFGDDANVIFDLNSRYSADLVSMRTRLRSIDCLNNGGRNISSALSLLINNVFTAQHGDRPDYSNVVLLILTGRSNGNKKQTIEFAGSLKQKGVRVIVVAITDQIDKNECDIIASSKKDIIFVSDFSTLNTNANQLFAKLCSPNGSLNENNEKKSKSRGQSSNQHPRAYRVVRQAVSGVTGPIGATGATGAPGISGKTGATGVTGIAGATGATGVPGVPGSTGASGLIGPVGATGSPGSPGGATGATGASGVPGRSGATGLTGPGGAAGAPGLGGQPGVPGSPGGATGATGLVGMTGASGLPGSPGGVVGAPGANGVPGRSGATGLTGPGGATGATGLVGQPGVPGSPGGATGATGLVGMTGASGLPGSPGGATGATGASGVPGRSGATGLTGVIGAIGAPGLVGQPGLPGSPGGATGATGPFGQPGLPGLPGSPGGATGAAGFPGRDGDTGSPGRPGLDGATGIKGDPGPKGPQGSTGPQGATGPLGPAGLTGIPGPPGPPGKSVPLYNKCLFNNGGCQHICQNTPESYYCTCNKGYKIENVNFECIALHTDNSFCGYYPVLGRERNSRFCFCKINDTTTLPVNGTRCVDFDECSVNNGGCQDQCSNTDGGYNCVCGAGLKLANDKHSCKDVDECQMNVSTCPSKSTCINTYGSFACYQNNNSYNDFQNNNNYNEDVVDGMPAVILLSVILGGLLLTAIVCLLVYFRFYPPRVLRKTRF